MDWFTSLPTWLLVVGSRRPVAADRVRRPDRDPRRRTRRPSTTASRASPAPLMPALGAAFGGDDRAHPGERGRVPAQSAQDLVSSEAAAASRLAWAATSPGVRSEPIHAALLRLPAGHPRHRVARRECRRGRSRHAACRSSTLERVVRAEAARAEIGTPASTELLASLDAVTSCAAGPNRRRVTRHPRPLCRHARRGRRGADRQRRRTGVSHGACGPLSWSSASPSSSGLSLALLFALSAPWQGPLIVSGQPIDAIVQDLRSGLFYP